MAKGYVLYNLKAGHQTQDEDVRLLEVLVPDELEFIDITRIKDYRVFFSGLTAEEYIILCGGDGTLNRFINDTEGIAIRNEIFYFPLGTGNDFAADLGYAKGGAPFAVTDYLKDLPRVTVKGKTYRFLNGVGYGIDGYCCEVGDKLKQTTDKPVNYTAIAVKGLLFHYKPVTATVTVDGKTRLYEKVWLAPTMKGRYYGGGMIPTPHQKRNAADKTLSVMVFHGAGKLKTLMAFPSIFKGEHIKHTDMVDVLTGHEITVEFDRPTALQIDGETIRGVTAYTALSPVTADNRSAVLTG